MCLLWRNPHESSPQAQRVHGADRCCSRRRSRLRNRGRYSGTIKGTYWSDDGVTLAIGSNSQAVGFWQTILYSNAYCFGSVDDVFGAVTKSYTQNFQTAVAHVTADGVVGSNTWISTEFATYTDAGGTYYRLVNHGSGRWTFYGGSASEAELNWDGTASGAWWWKHPVLQQWRIADTASNGIPYSPPC